MTTRLMLAFAPCALWLAACAAGDGGSATGTRGSMVPPPGAAYAPADAGRASLAAGDVAGAEASFGQVVDVNPFDPIAINNLAVAKAEAGQYHEALALLERAERLAPQNPEIAGNLARLRAWNQNYAMAQGVIGAAGSQPAPLSPADLPPEPPPLWDTRPSAQRVAAPSPAR